ncbi:MAG: hypothetical protein AB7G37_16370 [Solirubrobacteraceae bacterium]
MPRPYLSLLSGVAVAVVAVLAVVGMSGLPTAEATARSTHGVHELRAQTSMAQARAQASRSRAARKRAAAKRRARGRLRKVSSPMGDPSMALRFGAYPWAGVGTIDAADAANPDDPARAMAAVKRLQGDRSFVVHLYGEYTGTDPGAADHLMSDARWWSDAGVQVEMVLRFRPARTALAAGFTPWVRSVTRRLAGLPGLVAIQIGNEPNNTGSKAAADGAYRGAVTAIARAIPAASAELRTARRRDVGVGFNWAAGASPCTTESMWSRLRRDGGRAFTSAVDWVGVDVYPGTWSAPSRSATPTASLIDDTVTSALRCLRTKHLPAAGLGSATTITVAETGYPTDPTRSETAQRNALVGIVDAVQRVQARYGVTDLRWFSLRDANTASGQLENGYGLLRDDYAPKAGFETFRSLVATRGR